MATDGRTEAIVESSVLIAVAQVDVIKADWESSHRFRLKFTSFGEVI